MPFTLFLLIALSGWCVTPQYFDLPHTWSHASQNLGEARSFACRNLPNNLSFFKIFEEADRDCVRLASNHATVSCDLPHVSTPFALELCVWCPTLNETMVQLSFRWHNNTPSQLVVETFASPKGPLYPPLRPVRTHDCYTSDFAQYSAQKHNFSVTRFIHEEKNGDRFFLRAQVDYDNLQKIIVSCGVQRAHIHDHATPRETAQYLTVVFSDICHTASTISINDVCFRQKQVSDDFNDMTPSASADKPTPKALCTQPHNKVLEKSLLRSLSALRRLFCYCLKQQHKTTSV